MAHLLRLYADAGTDPATAPADGLALFDFGSGGRALTMARDAHGMSPPVASVIAQLQRQMAAGSTPRLDLVLVSHQDGDHWLLLTELMNQVEALAIPLVVGHILKGGTLWAPDASAVITRLARYTADADTDLTYFTTNQSSYAVAGGNVVDTFALGDLKVRTMISNVASAKTSPSIRRNCASTVALLQLDRLAMILPGDATFETLAQCNAVLAQWQPYGSPLPWIYMMSAPHHGALATMNASTRAGEVDLAALDAFIAYTRPYSVIASAGTKNNHRHPRSIIILKMVRYAGFDEFPPHPLVTYGELAEDRFPMPVETDSEWRVIDRVRQNVYTTVLNLTTPGLTADWLFEMTLNSHSTEVRPFDAGAPGILNVPDTDPMTLVADLINAKQPHDNDMEDGLSRLNAMSRLDARSPETPSGVGAMADQIHSRFSRTMAPIRRVRPCATRKAG
ncbi:hypothetical protein [Tistrella bauzanensis]|nr:hypothetical protein [Tistrella bauzanensis]